MSIRLTDQAFQPWEALAQHEAEHLSNCVRHGACTPFVGRMRDVNEGDEVQTMFLEHYPAMTEAQLQRIEAEARDKWPLLDVLIVHRVGEIHPGEAIVLTAAWSQHRQAAFEACRYLIEELKHRATFWKRETLTNGCSRWVEGNTPA